MSDSVAFAHLQSRSLIALGGDDWRSFLQGLITQDVDTLVEGEARFGALLTPQGRLLYDLFVVANGAGAWLDVEAGHRAAIIQRLSMYRLRAKVTIEADETTVFAAFQPLPLAGRGGGGGVDAGVPGSAASPPAPVPQGGGVIVRDPRLPELGWRCYGRFAPTVGEAEREAQKLRLGVPGPADWGSDRTYPIEANFDVLNGIDFKKGCFVGQETTSRMKRRGTIKSRMLPIAFDGPAPAPGTEVLAGDLRAGEVRSGGEGRAIALVRLDRALGRELSVDGRAARADVPGWLAGELAAADGEAGEAEA